MKNYDENKELWKKCAAFHGHVCGGLTIGYKAALYAMELLEMEFSEDEQIVCIAENDACGVEREICCSICGASRHSPSTTERTESLSAWC